MNKLVYYAGFYSALTAFLKLAGFVFFLWLARTLSVNNYANFGLLYLLQTGITTFAMLGIVEAVVGLLKEHRTEEQQRRLFAAANSALFIAVVSLIVVALFLYVTLLGPSATSAFTLASVLASGVLLSYSMLQAQIVRLFGFQFCTASIRANRKFCSFPSGKNCPILFCGVCYRLDSSVYRVMDQ